MAKRVMAISTPEKLGPLTADLLGDIVKSKRTQAGLTLEDAALTCGIAKDTITKIENARGGVRFHTILKVCEMLGIELFVKPWEEQQ